MRMIRLPSGVLVNADRITAADIDDDGNVSVWFGENPEGAADFQFDGLDAAWLYKRLAEDIPDEDNGEGWEGDDDDED